ncbi:MAG: hypothetical protein AAFO95_22060 [Cyanobacteria bacterium J06600_6]
MKCKEEYEQLTAQILEYPSDRLNELSYNSTAFDIDDFIVCLKEKEKDYKNKSLEKHKEFIENCNKSKASLSEIEAKQLKSEAGESKKKEKEFKLYAAKINIFLANNLIKSESVITNEDDLVNIDKIRKNVVEYCFQSIQLFEGSRKDYKQEIHACHKLLDTIYDPLITKFIEINSSLIDELLLNDKSSLDACLLYYLDQKSEKYERESEKKSEDFEDKDLQAKIAQLKLNAAKINLVLAKIYLEFSQYFIPEMKKGENREKGVKYCLEALKVYEQEKCEIEVGICHALLDIAYKQFVKQLKQYSGIVPEDNSIIRAIKEHSIAPPKFYQQKDYSYSDIVTKVIISAAEFSKDKKPPLKQNRQWRQAQIDLVKIVNSLEIPKKIREQDEFNFNSRLAETLHRNNLIRLVPQDGYSISQSLKIFILNKERIAYSDKDYYREQKKRNSYNGQPILRLDAPKYTEGKTSLVDSIISSEPTSWEQLIGEKGAKDNNEQRRKDIAHRIEAYIAEDPEGRLKNEKVQGHNQANCRSICA